MSRPQLGTIYIGRTRVGTRVLKVAFASPADAGRELQYLALAEPFSCAVVLKLRSSCGATNMERHDTGFKGTEILSHYGTIDELVAELEKLCPPAPARVPRPRPPVGTLVKKRGMKRARRVAEPFDAAKDPQLVEYWPQGCLHSVPGGAVEPTEFAPS